MRASINDRLDRLLDMKLADLITDIEYSKKKQLLEKERQEVTLSLFNDQIDQNELEPTKKVFEFLTDLVKNFKEADIAKKGRF